MSTSTSGETQRLGGTGRKLSLFDVVAQSIGFLGPVFSMAFLVPLVVGLISVTGQGAGTAAPLALLLAGIGILGVAYIVSQYAKRIHAAGSLYDYVTDGLGTKVGAAAGLLYYVGILFLGAALLPLIAGTIHDTLAAEFSFTSIPVTGWCLIILALVALIGYFGVALSTRAQLILALLSIATVVLFSLHVIISVGSKNDVGQAFSPSASPTGWSGLLFGIVYAVLMYTGFETAANLGEETENPKRDIPRAAVASVIVVAIVYMICSYAQVAGYGFDLDAMGKNAAAPLFGLAAPSEAGGFGGTAISRLLELVVVLDMFAVLLGCTVASSRGLFAMARDGRLPKPVAQVSGRGTPLNASIVVIAFYALWIFATRQFPHLFAIPGFPHYFAMFSWGAAFGGLALATIYFLVALGALRGLKDHDKPALVWIAALAGMAVTAAGIFGAFYQVPQPTLSASYAAAIVFVIGLVLAFLTRGTRISHHDFHEYSDLAASEQGPQKL